MSTLPVERAEGRLFAPARLEIERGPDRIVLRSALALGEYGRCIGDELERWAARDPDRPFLAERGADGAWETLSYGTARSRVWQIAAGLLEMDISVERPLAILSENSISHALLMLAAMHVGVPVLPVSPAYSLVSKDFAKLRGVFDLMTPGAVYVPDSGRFGAALACLSERWQGLLITESGDPGASGLRTLRYGELLGRQNDTAVAAAFARTGPDTIAKFLLTSGSTGTPKAVINTQRMLLANQQAKAQVWPFLARTPPVLVDWLPWNHTFGGNHNFNLVLRHGGTLYIDSGRPAPGLFDQTIANLSEIAPTIYLNVPRGFDMLVEALRAQPSLRERFFSRLQLLFYAAAALPQHLWDALGELSMETLGEQVVRVSSWGSTETAPLAADCHFQARQAGVIGVPVPGVELKLVPNGDKQEVRVRGSNVTPGYWRRPDLTRAAFDDEGFYRIGDAVRWLDAAHPEQGLLFDGRVAEDFKLASGTWVNVGMLRVAALAALAPLAQDVVVAGHDRDYVGILVFPNLAACEKMAGTDAAGKTTVELLALPALRAALGAGLARLAEQSRGSSTRVVRALWLAEPAQIDAGEITDKGYINQSAVLARRHGLVETLYREAPPADIVSLD